MPLLYWLGGGTLLFSWYIQNLALVKIYRRPKSLDHHVAERSRSFLCVLLFLHVASSTAFYTRQAHIADAGGSGATAGLLMLEHVGWWHPMAALMWAKYDSRQARP